MRRGQSSAAFFIPRWRKDMEARVVSRATTTGGPRNRFRRLAGESENDFAALAADAAAAVDIYPPLQEDGVPTLYVPRTCGEHCGTVERLGIAERKVGAMGIAFIAKYPPRRIYYDTDAKEGRTVPFVLLYASLPVAARFGSQAALVPRRYSSLRH